MSNKKDMVNPEIERERREKRGAERLYDDDNDYGMMLYPGSFLGGAASSTESTGLIRVIPPTQDMLEAYDEVYSYRRTEAADEEE